MTYREFKADYKSMIKSFPDTSGFYRESDTEFKQETIGQCETVYYEKHNTVWKETERKTENFSRSYYCNCVSAIPFFRGIGGYEKASKKYTKHGLIPYQIVSISPDRQNKTVRKFIFN